MAEKALACRQLGSGNDISTGLGSANGNCELHGVTLDNTKSYRMQFIGKGTHLQGRVYELPNTTKPIAVLDGNTADDGTRYTNGPVGFFAENLTDTSFTPCLGPVDVTFDNFQASIHSP